MRLPYEISCLLMDKQYRLELCVRRAAGSLLHAPTRSGMERRIGEALDAEVQVRLTPQGDNRPALFEGFGQHAGLEAAGDLERLRRLWASSAKAHR